ncbi:FMN reductase (NADPH) 2 (plasmid) [Rhizobium etli]|uniref:FMN reductase (NADPH) 2 n=1 Tax=Rhizobium etli TaxID=29449 RepID=A0AAN1BN84_RHIET|nr:MULTISPECIES: FMN reductase [Rhizobium]ARO32737.1 FMN reductase (NADPH) 1 [Rhizobium sp. NXC14]ARQ13546.1 FMN reductase (NADPH) 2 [Rhizobium etli]
MPQTKIFGFSGNITRPSTTRSFVEHIVGQLALKMRGLAQCVDVDDLGPSLLKAKRLDDLNAHARGVVDQMLEADALVVGSPTYKGSYTGLFKHYFDLLDPTSLRGKPIIIAATGGGERHSLVVEHQLRPLFGFFEALAMPTAIYATRNDFGNGEVISEPIRMRVGRAVEEAACAIG